VTGQTGKVRCLVSEHLLASADFATSLTTDSFRFVLLQCPLVTSTLIVYLEPAAISLHRDDGSSPRFIPTSLPDVPDQRADEQGENIHLIGAQLAQRSGIDSELTFSTSGNGYAQLICHG
jgi:hypothetical protein